VDCIIGGRQSGNVVSKSALLDSSAQHDMNCRDWGRSPVKYAAQELRSPNSSSALASWKVQSTDSGRTTAVPSPMSAQRSFTPSDGTWSQKNGQQERPCSYAAGPIQQWRSNKHSSRCSTWRQRRRARQSTDAGLHSWCCCGHCYSTFPYPCDIGTAIVVFATAAASHSWNLPTEGQLQLFPITRAQHSDLARSTASAAEHYGRPRLHPKSHARMRTNFLSAASGLRRDCIC
jgi:hypothetical protein